VRARRVRHGRFTRLVIRYRYHHRRVTDTRVLRHAPGDEYLPRGYWSWGWGKYETG
jgi:hypothetical protein